MNPCRIPRTTSTDKPNLIYILADDMGYGDLSCLNEKAQFKTVHLDRLARDGMRGADAHASSSVCTPSRYSLLTGRYNWRSVLKSGVTYGYSPPIIEKGRLTVASMLREQGWRTACVGKWHLGLEWALKDGGVASSDQDEAQVDFSAPVKGGPCDFGFDTFFGISASLDMPPYVYVKDDRVTSVPVRHVEPCRGMGFWRGGWIADDFKHEEVLTRLTTEVESLIGEYAKSDQPFFIYFPLPAPHTPILPTEPFRGKSGTNAYGDFCLQVDDTVGRVMHALKDNGLEENTIVIFTADNGCSPMADFEALARFGHHPSYTFRGMKSDIFEGGHRIPFVLRWPGVVPPDSVCAQTFCLSDLVATMAEITGFELPADAAEDSISNLSLWTQPAAALPVRDATVHHSINGSFSIRKGSWKLEMCPGSGGWSLPRGNTPEEIEGLPAIQLYDLGSDIGERHNRCAEHPEIVEELKALLTAYVNHGRSTPGKPQPNTGCKHWPQLHWLSEQAL
ncbi:MAG TPA: arylsulfatase [Verrucomicrobia bacterium]|nr:arylsulfatase [Verrucomicrobiota bacterium]